MKPSHTSRSIVYITTTALTGLSLVALLLAGCQHGKTPTDEAPKSSPQQPEVCWSGEDDDGDGAVDCDDTDCDLSDGCAVSWTEVAAAERATCGVTEQGAVWCWGDGQSLRRIGDDSERFVALDAGSEVACGVTEAGEAYCWGGWNRSGELGRADVGDLDTNRPIRMPLEARIASISVGGGHICAVDTEGGAWCWGKNSRGQIGMPGVSRRATEPPTRVAEELSFRELRAGNSYTCGITTKDELICWGYAPDLWEVSPRDVDEAELLEPRQLSEDAFRTLSVHTQLCAIDQTEQLHCWTPPGRAPRGPGDDESAGKPRIHRTTELDAQVSNISVGDGFVCAVSAQGEASCWGKNSHGQLGRLPEGERGRPSNEHVDAPTSIELPGPIAQLSAGDDHSCAVLETGESWCWGDNRYGQLGRVSTLEFGALEEEGPIRTANRRAEGRAVVGQAEAASAPADEPEVAENYQTGGGAVCWVMGDGVARCGLFDATAESPVRQSAGSEAARRASVAAGGLHACVIDPSNALWCIGHNLLGGRGTGLADPKLDEFTRVGGERTFAAVAASDGMTCAVDTDGDVWCWGANRYGQLGGEPGEGRAVPQRVDHEASFVDVTVGLGHICALDDERGAWCWGDNRFGQLGDGSMESKATPVAVAGDQRFVDVKAGIHHSCGLTERSEVYCWGRNDAGQIGAEQSGSRPEPVAVALDIDVQALAADATHSCAITSDGTQLWCWGGGAPEPTLRLERERIDSVSLALDHACVTSGEGMGACFPLSMAAAEGRRRVESIGLGDMDGVRYPFEKPAQVDLRWFSDDPKDFQERAE